MYGHTVILFSDLLPAADTWRAAWQMCFGCVTPLGFANSAGGQTAGT